MMLNVSEELESALAEARATVRTPLPWWLRPFLMRGVAAITLGRRIYARELSEALLWHELAHVRQMRRLGLVRFAWRYVGEYLRNRRSGMSASDAYRNISFEREAFAAETYNRRTGTGG